MLLFCYLHRQYTPFLMHTAHRNVKTSRTSKHFCQQRQRQQKPCHMLRRQQQAAITIAATANTQQQRTAHQPATIATITEGQQQSCIKAQRQRTQKDNRQCTKTGHHHLFVSASVCLSVCAASYTEKK